GRAGPGRWSPAGPPSRCPRESGCCRWPSRSPGTSSRSAVAGVTASPPSGWCSTRCLTPPLRYPLGVYNSAGGTDMHAIIHALSIAGSMTWEIAWALILGFALSAVVQAVVRRSTIVRLLGDDRPRTLAVAAGLGAASSSCSYAAVALARSLFRKGASFTAAMAFEIASTNLVVELGIILALLMGWQFTAAEFVGGPLMIVVLAVLFRLFVRTRLVDAARRQADRGLAGSMEGHAAMDMSVQREGSFWQRLLSREGFTSVSHVFVMEWAAILRDLVVGLLIAGAIAAWVPESFWQHFFFADHPVLSA